MGDAAVHGPAKHEIVKNIADEIVGLTTWQWSGCLDIAALLARLLWEMEIGPGSVGAAGLSTSYFSKNMVT